MTCLAAFTSEETGLSFLIGSLDGPFANDLADRLRCFLYSEDGGGGFRIAQSRDASCAQLADVEQDGARNIRMTVGEFGLLFGDRLALNDRS